MPADADTDLVAHVAARAGIAPPDRVARVRRGASNEVYELLARDGGRWVVRLSRRGDRRFLMERAVMERASAAGIPCPAVAHVERLTWRGAQLDAMVIAHVAGDRLGDVSARLTDGDRRRLAARAAEVLAAVHTLPVCGFGNLGPDLTGPAATFDEWFVDAHEPAFAAARRAASSPEEVVLVDAVHRELERARPLLRGCEPLLAHGDFSPGNLLVSGGRITAVLDWESAKSGSAALDFGWWDWFGHAFATPWPTETMLGHYARSVDVDRDVLDELRRLAGLRIAVGHLAWAAGRGDRGGAEAARALLRTV